MLIRNAAIKDLPEIFVITRDSLEYDYSIQDMRTQFEELLEHATDNILVAIVGDQVIGYVHGAYYLTFYGPSLVNILSLAVSLTAQKSGVGKALMTNLERWAQELGAQGIRLNSSEKRQEAHAFYQQIGYSKVKYQANFRKLF